MIIIIKYLLKTLWFNPLQGYVYTLLFTCMVQYNIGLAPFVFL